MHYSSNTYLVACAVTFSFFIAAPFVDLDDDNSFQRFAGIMIIGAGVFFLAVVLLTDSDGIAFMLSGPGSVICFGIGMMIWSHAILKAVIRSEKLKAAVTILAVFFSLAIVTLGPILVGIPAMYLTRSLGR